MESDWKKFRALVPVWRERYLVERRAGILQQFTDPQKTETERFWDTLEVMEQEARVLRHCLDGHSRSSMWSFLVAMASNGMIREADLADFSEELRAQMAGVFDQRK
jgi:predicted protein tyrosine phosphatase